MIQYYPNFLSNSECEYFIDMFKAENNGYCDDYIYKFYYIDLIEKKLQTEKFSNFIFKKFRVQMVNESIEQSVTSHQHINPWSFIVFLNDNFTGGEIIFSNIEHKPKTGDMIYFSGEEHHKVNNSVGNRYTLVGFMYNNPLSVKKDILI
jgi:hypothetical protein